MKILKLIFLIFIFSFQSIKAFGSPVFVSDKDIDTEMNTPTGILFNPSGSKMYVVGFTGSTDAESYIAQYSLSTPFSISSASLDENQDIISVLKRPQDIKFNSDGTKVFVLSTKSQAGNKDSIAAWNLSIPYDTTSLNLSDDTETFFSGTDPRGFEFNTDGTKMFILEQTLNRIAEYKLSTPFDPDSKDSGVGISISKVANQFYQGFGMSSDGTKMFVVKADHTINNANNVIEEYDLSVPFNIRTAVRNSEVYNSTPDHESAESIAGITFNLSQGANKLYYVDFNSGDLVREFDLPCAYGVISCIDPTKNKDDVASVEAQSTAAKQLIQHTTYPVINRMEWLRRNSGRINLTNQNLKLQLNNEILNALANSLVPLYLSSDNNEQSEQNFGWSFWSEGTISIGKVGDTAYSSSKDINTSAITLGVDKKGDDNIMRGIALRFGSDDVDVGDLGSALDLNSFSLTFYETRPRGENRFVDHLIGASFINSDLINNSGSISTNGERSGEQLYGSLSLRDTYSENKFNFTPKLKINYGITHFAAYEETGAEGLNLNFNDQYIGNLTSSLGTVFDNTYELEIGTFIPFFDFEYYADMSPSSHQKFSYASNGTSYTLKNINSSTHNISSSVGFDFMSNNGLSLMTKYSRNQAAYNKNESLIVALDYKSSQKSFYTLSLQDTHTKLSHNNELNGFKIHLDSHYNFFQANPDYGFLIKISKTN